LKDHDLVVAIGLKATEMFAPVAPNLSRQQQATFRLPHRALPQSSLICCFAARPIHLPSLVGASILHRNPDRTLTSFRSRLTALLPIFNGAEILHRNSDRTLTSFHALSLAPCPLSLPFTTVQGSLPAIVAGVASLLP